MSDAELRWLIQSIYTAATAPYPFAEAVEQNDDRLVYALGQIAGIALKALEETKND